MLSANQYYEHIRSVFSANENPEIAAQQVRYMKYHFEYFGIKTPIRVILLKDIFVKEGILGGEELREFIETCFQDDYREMHYAAIQMVEKCIKKQPEAFIEVLEYMLLNKSWWDSVDWISTLVGIHFQRYPHLIVPITERWMSSDNRWLQRICIIFQLKYKKNTDYELLSKYILAVANSKEFFLRKAAGWALRDISRHNPTFVIDFVEKNPHLSPLTKREALRLIGK
jgi:3-methyladenine DNA glycosylase AlkD